MMSEKEITYTQFGLLLGDGWYKKQRGYIEMAHVDRHEEYVDYLVDLFDQWGVLIGNKRTHRKDVFGVQRIMHSCMCRVPQRRHVEFEGRFWNQDGERVLSEYILRRITPLGLFLWYLDDGSLTVSTSQNKKNRQITLCTNAYSRTCNERAARIFAERFGFNWRVYTSSKGYSMLKMGPNQFKQFYDVVRPYIETMPNCMRYKFNLKYENDDSYNAVEKRGASQKSY